MIFCVWLFYSLAPTPVLDLPGPSSASWEAWLNRMLVECAFVGMYLCMLVVIFLKKFFPTEKSWKYSYSV